jgi:small conductance mechanosensitive channel
MPAPTPVTDNSIEAHGEGLINNLNGFVDGLSEGESGLMAIAITWGLRILAALVILGIGWVIGNWANRRFEALNHLDFTLKNFLGNFAKYIVVAVSVVTVIGLFGIPMASLLAVMGAAGLAIGLALQGTLSNVASGVMILLLRPFNVGDYIAFGDESGSVKTLGLFGCELATADNVYLYAPNSKIWGNEIKNYSRNDMRRQDINVGIGYNDDIDKAVQVILDLLNSDGRVFQEQGKKPEITVDALADFSVNLIVRFWSKSGDMWTLHGDITKKIKQRLEENGISIPYPTRTVEVVNDDMPSKPRSIAAG